MNYVSAVLRSPSWFLRKLARKGLRQLGLQPKSRPWVPGLPAGLDQELLQDICTRVNRETIRQTAHIHLSSFKASGGASRIQVIMVSGRRWTVCYKDSRYGHQEAPASVDYPIILGSPEYGVYARANGALRALLPDVYHCEEVEAGRRYRYLLEDIRWPYLMPTRRSTVLAAVAMLRHIENAVGSWERSSADNALIRYDHAFIRELTDYSERILKLYGEMHPTNIPYAASQLDGMFAMMTQSEFHEYMEPTGVHGDCNRGSLRINTVTGSDLKVIDWEWAGVGLPHFDLAILLESTGRADEERSLRIYAEQRPGLRLADHTRLYHWARLTTCVLNAAGLAADALSDAPNPRVDRCAYIRHLLEMATLAHQRLEGVP